MLFHMIYSTNPQINHIVQFGGSIRGATTTPILNREIISPNAHFKIHGVMHVAPRQQLSVADVNLFEASAPPTKVKHAASALTLI